MKLKINYLIKYISFKYIIAFFFALMIAGGEWRIATSDAGYVDVVRLEGTPHIWLRDTTGAVRWVGDTRALQAVTVPWNQVRTITLTSALVKRLDPLLSAGLLKDGEPIYLVKWETSWVQPVLQHIQSIDDVRVFGINETNYGRFVLDRRDWESRYGFSVDSLVREELQPAVATVATATPIPASTPLPTATPRPAYQTATLVPLVSLPAQPALSALVGNAIKTQIDGAFTGWSGSTLVKLRNGQVWQQAEYLYEYYYAYGPTVLVFQSGGNWMMLVEGMSQSVSVRLQSTMSEPSTSGVIQSQIDDTFNGWDGETIFRLSNGQVWQQASYAYHYHYAYRPKVMIYQSGGNWVMNVDGVTSTIRVKRLV